MICNNCGKELKDGAKFCGYCGTKLEQKIENGQPKENISKKQKEKGKKKTVIIISCILLTMALIVGILIYFNNKEERNINIEESYQNSGNNEDIIMYEWEKFGATETELENLTGAEINEKYEYILYDKQNRELVYINGKGTMTYYQMYEEIDKYTYKVYKLSSNMMLAEPYREEIKLFKSDGKGNILNEEIIRDETITFEEHKQLEFKYIKYIDENKDHRNKDINIIDSSSNNNNIEDKIINYVEDKMKDDWMEPTDVKFTEAKIIEKDKDNKYLLLVHRLIFVYGWNGEYVNDEKDFYSLVIVKADSFGEFYIDESYGYEEITEEFEKSGNDINSISELSKKIKNKNNWKY